MHRNSRNVSPTLAIIFPWELTDVDIHSETDRESELVLKMCVLVTQSCLTLCDPLDYSRQATLCLGFSRQEYLSGLPFPSPGDLPNPRIKPMSLALQADALLSELLGKALYFKIC